MTSNDQTKAASERLDEGCFLAHSSNDDGAGVAELLREHLRRVADRAARFAAAFGADQQARAAGILHDLGKYGDQFQERLRNPRKRGRDHWTVGALAALRSQNLGLFPALAIAGHHAGLGLLLKASDLCREMLEALKTDPQKDRFTETDLQVLRDRFAKDGLEWPQIKQGLVPTGRFAADMLDVRMLFSALVDADFLETEAHFNGDARTPYRPRIDGPRLDIDRAIDALDCYVARVRQEFRNVPMAAARMSLYRACIAAAERPPGLFTLSAPTGAGKTLAMLAFALHHARTHNLRRVVLVMPFLNIIDQTAQVYRDIFSQKNGFDDHTVLEHHSVADHGDATSADGAEDDAAAKARLLTENWDSPIILTTSVQFFESLFSDRPSRCRKLHRLAQSVILFDEVQTLPLKLAVPTLAALSRLADAAGPYRATVVFATATQPAFDALDTRVRGEFAAPGWQPIEIVPAGETPALYTAAAGRVRIEWRHKPPIDLDDLAHRLEGHPRVLCIVNLKRHAARLAATLRDRGTEGLLHLSTNMCPAHRAKVLETVNLRLREGSPIRLVATQCVEAGVDLDFPVVYRALAPLEAIAQAAGRCNRHGCGEPGRVVVFKPQDDRSLYPPGYGEAVDATESFLAYLSGQTGLDTTEVLNSPERLRDYFRHFYQLSGRASTERDDERRLLDAIRAGDFREVASLYKLIPRDTIQVLVPYDLQAFQELVTESRKLRHSSPGSVREWCRRAAPYAVGLFRPRDDASIIPFLEPVQFGHRPPKWWEAEWFVATREINYDPLVGVSEPVKDLWIV